MRPLNRLRPKGDDRGAVLVWVALMMTVLLGTGALVIDTGALYHERRQLQNGADAGALAVAQDCAQGDCHNPAATANTYADQNASDGAANIDTVCGSGPGLPACASPPAGTAGASGWVKVTTSTDNPSNSAHPNQVRFLLAPLLDAANVGKTVHATAVAAWGAPKQATTVDLTFSVCEFAKLGGSVSPPVFPTGRSYIYFHDTTDAGTCPMGPSGADLPGGFGWLNTSGACQANIDAGGWVSDKPGNSVPNNCDPTTWRNTEVLVPLYDQVNGLTGSNGSYHIAGFVGFRILGYRFPSQQWDNGFPCPGPKPKGNATYICGEFTRVTTTGDQFGGADYGARVIKMIG
jgi:Flp pilus assembly protein TadG